MENSQCGDPDKTGIFRFNHVCVSCHLIRLICIKSIHFSDQPSIYSSIYLHTSLLSALTFWLSDTLDKGIPFQFAVSASNSSLGLHATRYHTSPIYYLRPVWFVYFEHAGWGRLGNALNCHLIKLACGRWNELQVSYKIN